MFRGGTFQDTPHRHPRATPPWQHAPDPVSGLNAGTLIEIQYTKRLELPEGEFSRERHDLDKQEKEIRYHSIPSIP